MSAAIDTDAAVIWHDLECGGYSEDLALWRELAGAAGDPVLELGAGTGRVTLDLAGAGHAVLALERDPVLLAALARRAAGRPVTTLAADAQDFAVPEPVGLCLVPMQTLQLLGAAGRARVLRCAARALRRGGLLAAALADPLEGFDAERTEPPPPDVCVVDGVRYVSQPVAVRDEVDAAVIERIRTTTRRDGRRTAETDAVRLHRLSPTRLEREGRAAGFRRAERLHVGANQEYVGSQVVVLRA